uniref:Putative alpha-2 adrenergic receptor n=2 Tax=Cupiennius salei TaxID=6928 RepID=A0A345K5F8_CUPSA|nr:putative alpha-2 adrenergic receptor [Cupiennius salei]
MCLCRYWSVTHAVEYLKKRTPRRSLLMIGGVWVLSAVISLPPLVGWKKPEKPSDYPECLLSDDVGYVLYSAFGSFYVPAFVMVFVYCRIFVAARSRARRHLKQRQRAAAELTTACDPAKSTTTTTTTCTSFSNASPTRADPPAAPLEKIPESNGDGPPVVVVAAPEIVIDEEEAPPPTQEDPAPSPDASRTERCQLFVAETQARRTSLLKAPKFLKSPFGSTLSLAELGRSEEDLGDLGSGKKKGGKRDKANKKKAQQDSSEAPRRQQPATTEAERQRRRIARAKERRATLILGLIMASFILAWLPFFVLYVLEALCRSACDIGATGFAIAFWLGYCNSALNPIIYTIFNRDFRRAFRKILFK